MAITAARYVESVMRGGAASVVMTCQRIGESRGIRRRRWSRFVAVIAACRGVVELCEICHKKWSRAAVATAACQGMMELRGVRHRRWGRVVAALRARQGSWICRLKLGNGRSSVSVEVRVRSSWR